MLESQSLIVPYNKVELPLIPVLAMMSFFGMKCDMLAIKSYEKPLKETTERITKESRLLLRWSEFDPTDLHHVSIALFDKLGLPVPEHTKRIRQPNSTISYYSTSKKVLQQLTKLHPLPEMLQVRAFCNPRLIS